MFTNALTAIGSGTAITVALLYVMQFLISLAPGAPPDTRDHLTLDWVRVPPRDDPPRTIDTLPDREDLQPPELPPWSPQGPQERTPINVPRQGPQPPKPGHDFRTAFYADGPLVSVVLVQPVYPVRALEQSLEGYVVVQFDVAADGTVGNVVVVESSHSVFERSAIQAAQRFRYKPRVVDGVPLPTPGVQARLTFRLDS